MRRVCFCESFSRLVIYLHRTPQISASPVQAAPFSLLLRGLTTMPRRKRGSQNQDKADEDITRENPTSRSLYEVLGVERTATQDQIRKAYHKLALRLHPDKNPDDDEAKEKFQSLQNVIAILGDPDKRKVYDETGSTEDAELSSETVRNLYEFFRTFYKKVTEDDIDDFAASYQGSEEEKKDLKNLFTKCKGNMERVFDQLMCSEPEKDSHRLMDMINDFISDGELKEYDAYKKWAKKVAKTPGPSDNPKPAKKSKKSDEPDSSLMALISNRQKQRNAMDSLTAALEAKYSGKEKSSKKGKKQAPEAEPSEEEFEAARKRISERMKSKAK